MSSLRLSYGLEMHASTVPAVVSLLASLTCFRAIPVRPRPLHCLE